MPLDDRDYVRGLHPPTCSCVECTKDRLERIKKHPELMYPLSKEVLRGPHVPSKEERKSSLKEEDLRKVNHRRAMKVIAWILWVLAYLVAFGIVYLGGVGYAILSKSWVWSEHGPVVGVSIAVIVVGDLGCRTLMARAKRKSERKQGGS